MTRYGLMLLVTAFAIAMTYHAMSRGRWPVPPVIEAAPPIPVLAEINAAVREVYVKPGSVVRVGDPLLELRSSALTDKKRNLEEAIHQREIGGTSAEDLSRWYVQLLDVHLDLSRCTITSPADGIVLMMRSATGQTVVAGEAVGVIGNVRTK